MAQQRYPVGIDLGTTFSSLAYVDEDGRLESLRLPNGRFSIASAVYFKSADEVIVGDEALEFSLMDASRVASGFKRQMGRSDFTFEANGKQYRPEELSAMVLKKLVGLAAEKIGPIENAVISVPFVFDEVRRRGTQDAAHLAGIKQVDLVDEPVAAALAYGHTMFQGGGLFGDELLDAVFDNDYVLVYDLGGGTFDATIMKLGRDGKFEVLATNGDEQLGGIDWDEVLTQILLKQLRELIATNPEDDLEFMQELKLKVVTAKETLSERGRAEVKFTYEDKDHTIVLTRGDFERESRPLVSRTLSTLSHMFLESKLTWSHIDRVLMVGGSSRMPMIRKQIELISDRQLDMSLSPDTAIAKGAALYAMFRSGKCEMRLKEVVTVNSHPLGLMVKNPKNNELENDVLLYANVPTLTRVERRYRIQNPDKPVSLVILLGDFPDPNACVVLGKLRMKAPGRAGSGKQAVDVSYCFQQNGLLLVEGTTKQPGGKKPLKAQLEVAVEGKMTEEEFDAAAESLRGISIE